MQLYGHEVSKSIRALRKTLKPVEVFQHFCDQGKSARLSTAKTFMISAILCAWLNNNTKTPVDISIFSNKFTVDPMIVLIILFASNFIFLMSATNFLALSAAKPNVTRIIFGSRIDSAAISNIFDAESSSFMLFQKQFRYFTHSKKGSITLSTITAVALAPFSFGVFFTHYYMFKSASQIIIYRGLSAPEAIILTLCITLSLTSICMFIFMFVPLTLGKNTPYIRWCILYPLFRKTNAIVPHAWLLAAPPQR